jgi:hypothetical protein
MRFALARLHLLPAGARTSTAVRAKDHLLLDVPLALPRHDLPVSFNILIAPFYIVLRCTVVDTPLFTTVNTSNRIKTKAHYRRLIAISGTASNRLRGGL